MTDSRWAIRRAVPGDASFLADMLVETVNWSPEWEKKSRHRVLATPSTARYLVGWPRESDLGVIAHSHGEPIGAAWLRLFPADEPGYGFVAPDVPELTLGVSASWRGLGVGRSLLRAAADEARAAGHARISLSVERKNFAQQLYLSEGYRIVDSSDKDSDTMIKELTADPAPSPRRPAKLTGA